MRRMSIRTSPWPAGLPCWADLTVSDVAGATAFYSTVLGWSFDEPDDQFGGYVIGQIDGAAAAGIGPMQPGTPTAWTLYFASDDADATAATVTEHGGTMLLPPGEVGELGRLFVASDPTGAVFGVWQAGTHIGAGAVNRPGGLTWEDLRTPDPDTARTFYAGVFGYEFAPVPMAPADYTTFSPAGDPTTLGGIGGMMGMEGVPPHWVVYFGVADADKAVTTAVSNGGSVRSPAMVTPYGKMAGLTDPEGAMFFVIEADPANQPDRSG